MYLLDKGDKAGYKANTGAIKYYLANTFMVATGDDPETETPEGEKTPPKGKKTSQPQTPTSGTCDYRKVLVDYCCSMGLDLNKISSEFNLKRGANQEEYKVVCEKVGAL